MGLTRKILSASTLGAVDMRSDKERTAAYTKASKKQAERQTALMEQQAKAAQQAAFAQQAAAQAAQQAPVSSGRTSTPLSPPSTAGGDMMAQLAKLGEMRQAGLLTDEEFTAAKAKLLS
jgi:hypothetical protein